MVITYDDFYEVIKEVDRQYNIIQEDKHFFSLGNNHIMERCYGGIGKIGCLINERSDLNIFNHGFVFFTLLSSHIKNQSFYAGLT